jgi:hypothetical protein
MVGLWYLHMDKPRLVAAGLKASKEAGSGAEPIKGGHSSKQAAACMNLHPNRAVHLCRASKGPWHERMRMRGRVSKLSTATPKQMHATNTQNPKRCSAHAVLEALEVEAQDIASHAGERERLVEENDVASHAARGSTSVAQAVNSQLPAPVLRFRYTASTLLVEPAGALPSSTCRRPANFMRPVQGNFDPKRQLLLLKLSKSELLCLIQTLAVVQWSWWYNEIPNCK